MHGFTSAIAFFLTVGTPKLTAESLTSSCCSFASFWGCLRGGEKGGEGWFYSQFPCLLWQVLGSITRYFELKVSPPFELVE